MLACTALKSGLLQGTLPDWGGLMPKLETLLIASNYLSGVSSLI